jgi:hypothetical protein
VAIGYFACKSRSLPKGGFNPTIVSEFMEDLEERGIANARNGRAKAF